MELVEGNSTVYTTTIATQKTPRPANFKFKLLGFDVYFLDALIVFTGCMFLITVFICILCMICWHSKEKRQRLREREVALECRRRRNINLPDGNLVRADRGSKQFTFQSLKRTISFLHREEASGQGSSLQIADPNLQCPDLAGMRPYVRAQRESASQMTTFLPPDGVVYDRNTQVNPSYSTVSRSPLTVHNSPNLSTRPLPACPTELDGQALPRQMPQMGPTPASSSRNGQEKRLRQYGMPSYDHSCAGAMRLPLITPETRSGRNMGHGGINCSAPVLVAPRKLRSRRISASAVISESAEESQPIMSAHSNISVAQRVEYLKRQGF